ncbi:hypothetical protein [Bacillus marinisedimentorum]|uniref:hypothetical protein n=1 Tax=Bacillus marinisedimentorum TaxID=1821260 RepID=UPI0008730AD8|nr:hypothetical protein [Bacillus marinisedimentorum]
MRLKKFITMNGKPLIIHILLAVFGTGIVGFSWNSSVLNEMVAAVFILTILLHYFAGVLLINYGSPLKNLSAVSLVFLFDFMIFLLRFVSVDHDSLMNSISFVFSFPFLYLLGWKGVDYSLLTVLIPSFLFWAGLESKVAIARLSGGN